MRCLRVARAAALVLALVVCAATTSCALLPCQPYSCADGVCGCLPQGPLFAARARGAGAIANTAAGGAAASLELAPDVCPVSDAQGF